MSAKNNPEESVMKSKLDNLRARHNAGTINQTYYRRIKVLVLNSATRIKV